MIKLTTIEMDKNLLLAEKHFENAVKIWNHVGLENPQLRVDAARDARDEYLASLRSLDLVLENPENEPLEYNLLLGHREITQAAIFSMEKYLYDEWTNDGLLQIILLTGREIKHLKQAIDYFEDSSNKQSDYVTDRHLELLSLVAIYYYLQARLSTRHKDVNKALEHYQLASKNYSACLQAHETISPQLKTILPKAQATIDKQLERAIELDVREPEDNKMRWTAISLRFQADPIDSPYEDRYRRLLANALTCKSMIEHLHGLDLLNDENNYTMADSKISKSITHLRLAMEVFPENLNYHRDLFSVYMLRGEMFGCQAFETTNYYHINCPLAIMYWLGAWYTSPTIEYDKLACNICNKDILDCDHYLGQSVSGKVVRYERIGVRITSISMVDIPEDPSCHIEWWSIPKSMLAKRDNELRTTCYFCRSEEYAGKPFELLNLPPEILEGIEKQHQTIKQGVNERYLQVQPKQNLEEDKK